MTVDGEEAPGFQGDLTRLLREKIENLRVKLLDLSRRNPLISAKLGPRSGSFAQVIDELPDILFANLSTRTAMRFIALPSLDDDPRDEQTPEFRSALVEARVTDEVYLEQLERLGPDSVAALDRSAEIERALKDRVREALGMPARATKGDISLSQHARNNNISPSYDLPSPD